MVEQQFAHEALDFGRVVRSALETAGGDDLVRAAEAGAADGTLGQVLAGLGVWDLDPLADETQLQAAALACREAGSLALPYPMAERLTRTPDLDADAVALVAGRVSVPDASLRWLAVGRDGALSTLTPVPGPRGSRLAPFVTGCDLRPTGEYAHELVPLALVLSSYTLLGMMRRAIELTLGHTRARRQFGQGLISFQAVQYQAVDATVAVQLVEELARHAVWSLAARKPGALVDAVALRSEALAAADVVFRVAHQLHGATGFCDESFVSWLSRHSQALRRLPLNGPATDAWLAELIDAQGFDGLFRRDLAVRAEDVA